MEKRAEEKIGQYVQRVMANTTLKNAEILKLVGEQFPAAKTTAACIAWYRTDLKKKPVVKEENLETIDAEIKATETKLEELKAKREAWLEANAERLETEKQELITKLRAMGVAVEA